VKNLAKLIIFFTLTFIITFVIVTGIKFLSLRIEWTKILPPKPETSLTLLISAAHWALSLSIFSSIIIVSNYSARKKYFALMSLAFVMAMSFLFCFGITTALEQWKFVPPAQTPGIPLGGKGVILSNTLNRNETAVVLLKGTVEPLGARVISIPEQPLAYHRTGNASVDLPPIPFGDDTPWFLKEIDIDVRLNAEMFRRRFSEGLFSFMLYAGALIYLLCSLGYAVKISVWPLANLFLTTLLFRGILALNTFFNTQEIQQTAASFLENKIPVANALSYIFLAFGTLVNVFSFLVFAAKRRVDDD
jgi:hypothetical protein